MTRSIRELTTFRPVRPSRTHLVTFVLAALTVWCADLAAAQDGQAGSSPEIFVHAPNAPSYDRRQDRIAKYIASDPRLKGAQLVVPWSAVDKGNQQYDWGFVERAMAPWTAAGKTAGLSFYGSELRTTWNFDGVPATPKYVLDQVPTVRCNVPGQPYLPNTPIYFEAPYLDNYKSLIKAAIRHYEGDPRVSYIRFGFGAGDESFPASNLNKDPQCVEAWIARGLSFDRWLKYSIDLIDYMGQLNPKTRIFVPFNDVGQFGRAGGEPRSFATAIATQAAKYGFTIGNEGFGFNYKFNDLYREFASRAPLYMQTGSVARINDHEKFASILEAAQSLRITTYELYVAVWLIAYDPNHPLHARYGEAYRRGLDSIKGPR